MLILFLFFRLSTNEISLLQEDESDLELSDDESRPNPTIDIVIQPPEPEGFITDEDSDKSDDEVAGDFVHLPRKILVARAEIGSSAAENVPAFSSSGEPTRKNMKNSRKQWVKNFSKIPEKPPRVFGPNIHGYLHSCCRTPAEAFSLFFLRHFWMKLLNKAISMPNKEPVTFL